MQIQMTNRIMCHKHEPLLKLNIFNSWSGISLEITFIFIYRIETHGLKNGNAHVRKRWMWNTLPIISLHVSALKCDQLLLVNACCNSKAVICPDLSASTAWNQLNTVGSMPGGGPAWGGAPAVHTDKWMEWMNTVIAFNPFDWEHVH